MNIEIRFENRDFLKNLDWFSPILPPPPHDPCRSAGGVLKVNGIIDKKKQWNARDAGRF